MRTISEADLTRMALDKGAVVEIDGRTINASRSKLQLAPRQPEKPVPPPPVAPPPAPPPPVRVEMDTAALLDASRAQADQMGRLVGALITEMRAQRDASPKPILAWDFKVVRDNKDRLETLRATAIR